MRGITDERNHRILVHNISGQNFKIKTRDQRLLLIHQQYHEGSISEKVVEAETRADFPN